MSRKSQMQSQLFIYIMTLLIIGLLLYFGFGWISKLFKTQSVIDATKFQVDLENAFEKIRPNYGSTSEREFLAPDGVDRICFVDTQMKVSDRKLRGLCNSANDDYDPVMCNQWMDNTSAIMFSPAIERDIDIGSIVVDATPGYLCFDTTKSRRFTLLLTGLGNRVKVKSQ